MTPMTLTEKILARHAGRDRHDDANDQAGLEHLTENNDQRCDHSMPHFTMTTPLVVAAWKSSKNS